MDHFLNPSLPTGTPVDAWKKVRSEMDNLKFSSKKYTKTVVIDMSCPPTFASIVYHQYIYIHN